MRVAIGSDHAGFELKDCTINLPFGPASLIGTKRMADGSPLRRSFLRRSHEFVILPLGRHEYRAISRPSGPRCVRVRAR